MVVDSIILPFINGMEYSDWNGVGVVSFGSIFFPSTPFSYYVKTSSLALDTEVDICSTEFHMSLNIGFTIKARTSQ